MMGLRGRLSVARDALTFGAYDGMTSGEATAEWHGSPSAPRWLRVLYSVARRAGARFLYIKPAKEKK